MATIVRPPIKYSVASALVTVLAVQAQCFGTPLPLIPVSPQPVINAPQPLLDAHQLFFNGDTSQGTSAGLRQPVGLPPGAQSFAGLQRLFQSVDTTRGTPLTLTSGLPAGAQSFLGPQTFFNVLNTSQGTPLGLLQPVSLPPGTTSFISSAQRIVNYGDTSQSSQIALYTGSPTLPPGGSSFVALPTFLYMPVDTSQIGWANYIPPGPPPAPPQVISGGAYPYDYEHKRKHRRDTDEAPTESYLPVEGDGPDAAEGLPPEEFAKRLVAARDRQKAAAAAIEDENIRSALLWMMMHDDNEG